MQNLKNIKKKHICFICPKAYPLFNSKISSTFGGAEVQMSMLARELARDSSYKVSILVGDYGQNKHETIDNVMLIKSFYFKKNILAFIARAFSEMLKVGADCYIQRSMTNYTFLLALICKIYRRGFVYMVAHNNEVDGGKTVRRSKISTILSWLVFKTSSAVITQNHYQHDKVSRVTKRAYAIKSGYRIKDNVLNHDRKHFLWVGRSEKWKRPEVFITLARKFNKNKFVMICPRATRASHISDDVKKLASNVPNVEFLDFVPFDKIGKYFEDAIAYINTSTQEGFPNTFIQSMIAGTPIVSLAVNPDNFFAKSGAGIFCSNEISKMIQGVKQVSESKIIFSNFSGNASKYAKENHDMSKIIEQFKKVILKHAIPSS